MRDLMIPSDRPISSRQCLQTFERNPHPVLQPYEVIPLFGDVRLWTSAIASKAAVCAQNATQLKSLPGSIIYLMRIALMRFLPLF